MRPMQRDAFRHAVRAPNSSSLLVGVYVPVASTSRLISSNLAVSSSLLFLWNAVSKSISSALVARYAKTLPESSNKGALMISALLIRAIAAA